MQHIWYELDQDAVIEAVESLGYLSDLRLFPLNSYENRVWQVGIEDSVPLIAKFYRPNRWSNEQIIAEHQFTRHLADAEMSVVPPIAIDEQTLFSHKDFRFSIFKRQGGHAPELDNFDHLEKLGRALGEIHQLGQQVDLSLRDSMCDARMAKVARDFIIAGDWAGEAYRTQWSDLSGDMIEQIDAAFKQVNPKLIALHGDCHPGNILWRDDRPHFVDFDDCIRGPAIADLWMFLSGDRADKTAQLDAIIENYELFTHFDQAELALIEPLRAMRLLHYTGWLARRWEDPAFPMHFPWFNSERYWGEQILALREQLAALNEAPLSLVPY